jgi:hypothetical protein
VAQLARAPATLAPRIHRLSAARALNSAIGPSDTAFLMTMKLPHWPGPGVRRGQATWWWRSKETGNSRPVQCGVHDSAWGEGVADHVHLRNAGTDLVGETPVW